ncbi:MAG: transcriptional regulator, TetR family [Ilumatobacteraceae bacterium]|nr:transcriptional regulator, TetR family [Ilumatobacteraceae bacterium]
MRVPGESESVPCNLEEMVILDAEVLGANKSGRRANRRGELLSIAAQLFAERGFAGVTVDEIGTAAGVSGPSLYHHFDGKEALLGEMLIRISESLLARATTIIVDEPKGRRLGRLIGMHAEFAVDNPSLITVHMRDLVHARETDGPLVRSLQAAYVDIWVGVIIDSKRGGVRLDNRKARAMTHAVLGLINSTPFSARLRREAMVELLTNMACAALADFVVISDEHIG